ncbi:MAG: hypothetical protein RL199_563 [Pseudomonadota bacterium]|jgi:hypothetical protein
MHRLLYALVLVACSTDRADQLEARVAELKAETERLSRDLADLRRAGPSPAASPVASSSGEAEAMARAALEGAARALPPVTTSAELAGVWMTREGEWDVAVHYRADGKLCGWRRLPGAARERAPFWGRWERHGRLVVELLDRWVGDHNEHDVSVRVVDALDASSMRQSGTGERSLSRVAKGDWRPLASLYDDREAPIPGLPKECFAAE